MEFRVARQVPLTFGIKHPDLCNEEMLVAVFGLSNKIGKRTHEEKSGLINRARSAVVGQEAFCKQKFRCFGCFDHRNNKLDQLIATLKSLSTCTNKVPVILAKGGQLPLVQLAPYARFRSRQRQFTSYAS